MKERIPLLNELIKYHKEKNLLLSMPGNKAGLGFFRDDIGKEFAEKLGFLDITEVDHLDNLHCPEGVIKEAQELLSKTYNAKKAYFLVNGSSCGNLASIFDAFDEGDEVIVERNCHKSIYNALILRKLKVRYIEPIVDTEKDIFLPPNKENIYKSVDNCNNPKGIILTYPNYFGITYDIEEIIKDLKKRNLNIIIDAAHGAHFGQSDKLPKDIYYLADYVVLSAHKTLPALTQGAYLLVNKDSENIEFYLKTFMSTSPSYLIMASLDYSRHYLDEYGVNDYKELICKCEIWKDKINSLNKAHILSKEDLKYGYDIDATRYVIILQEGYSGHKFLDYLRENKIQAEMSFSRGVVLILSPFNLDADFKHIYNVMEQLELNLLKNDKNINAKYYSVVPNKKLEPYEVFKLKGTHCKIKVSEGKISKNMIIPYPPGIPLVCPGEVISSEAINIIEDYILNKKSIIGVENNIIEVVLGTC
ncbi:aminotransferase class I/II-fold pyridoxal phosphate-dependent enzyme [Clostridium botulinum]|uniref:Aminotransferase class I/II-fold pyridoxal phosphate-dependent enzyme n=1 Tax=Clostridium botulinum TaxID=1491 RepID=A0A846JYL7_CLOBO|nr:MULTISPECIES: aminotransferase class I/II-fold pyridoxal phosphate-dependent enzyme [Clostridium]KAI3349830.1 aminotransferase class I/II-fold pyridoxal phosphate-dependent enzyme [Clostridium botulinum]KOM87210.1 decarboxylase [Clostridium botulinum]KOR55916.1 decarboxylase [Clostridium botulinum]MBY7025597.1 aminotransferase class I/II-fold pyridoxal phosphate-dependent enzyme [Clostridium botulinum]MCS6112626.1 aminotransferase class I/II-fold pyridoxal phosphate-dependent enzyme [Clostr